MQPADASSASWLLLLLLRCFTCCWCAQVSAVPLWARRALVGQLDAWQHALLWQHAASPLEVSGNVGLVHLLRVGQEVRCKERGAAPCSGGEGLPDMLAGVF